MVKVVVLDSINSGQMYIELQKLPVVIYKHGEEDILDISPKGVINGPDCMHWVLSHSNLSPSGTMPMTWKCSDMPCIPSVSERACRTWEAGNGQGKQQ